MSAEARYFRVGLFMFVGIGLIGSCAVILGGQGLFQTPVPFETYFDESVQGLEKGSPVKFRGVSIGTVRAIGFVGDRYDLNEQDQLKWGSTIYVRMDLVGDTPDPEVGIPEMTERRRRNIERMIDKGLRLRLATQGLTGLSYVEADYLDPERFPEMEIGWKPKRLYVPSAPSTFKALSTAAERIFERLEDVEVEAVVRNLDTLLVNLNEKVSDIDTERATRQLSGLVDELRATNARVQRSLDGGKYDFEVALENLRVASENLRDLTETAREYPSLMILGQPPKPTPGVGAK
jgi:phospholipid/cholesterol/gamma-HCH transport system substrate-binding protein/paraquat-inducible protein B